MTRPVGRTHSGESWEVVEHARKAVGQQLDALIKGATICPCPNAPDSVKHYDTVQVVAGSLYPAPVLAALLAEAVTRLAGIKAAGQ